MSTAVFVADQEKSAREQAAGRLTFNHSTDIHQHVINGTSMFQIKHGSACMTQRLTGVHACSRAEWSQVGTEVSYNRCRYGVLHKGQLGLYQVGSPSLGQLVGADDIEKAAVGWDVFRIAKLADLKVCSCP